MFYLVQFFKILFKSPVRGFFLFFFSIALVFSIGQKNYLEEQFTKMIPENKAGDSFYALISSNESYQTVARQMSQLPGVFRVEILSETQIKEEVKNVFIVNGMSKFIEPIGYMTANKEKRISIQ